MSYFDSIQNRVSLPLFRAHCDINKLPTAISWEKTKEKIEDEISKSPQRRSEVETTLEKIYLDTLSLGKRAIRIFEINSDKSEEVFEILSKLEPEPSVYLDSFPRILPLNILTQAPNEAYLCQTSIQTNGDVVENIFCTKRMFIEKEERTRENIGSEAINEFGWQNYDEFILIKRKYSQCFEYTRFNKKTNILEILVEERSGSDSAESFNIIQSKVNSILAEHVGLNTRIINAKNFFPAIDNIYKAANEGIVVELGFTTMTGSAKLEKMRITKKDLRKEEFHLGGKGAIGGNLTPFRLAVRWNIPGNSLQEEALLPGSIRQLSNGTPQLDHVVLSRALTAEAMQAMLNRIVSYLPVAATHA